MDVQEALETRRTVHQYRPDPVSPEALERALRAAHQAPCHRHTFPWRFTVVGPEARARLADVAVACKELKRPLSEEGRQGVRAKVLDPGALIVPSIVRNEDPAVAEEDYAATACAVQNLCLSLWGSGVRSKWTTGAVTTAPETYRILGIDPALERIVGFVWAGHAAAEPPEVRRPALETVVRRLP